MLPFTPRSHAESSEEGINGIGADGNGFFLGNTLPFLGNTLPESISELHEEVDTTSASIRYSKLMSSYPKVARIVFLDVDGVLQSFDSEEVKRR